MAADINAVTGTNVNSHFQNTITDRRMIAEIAVLDLAYPAEDACLCSLVSQRSQPFVKGVLSRFQTVTNDLERGMSVA